MAGPDRALRRVVPLVVAAALALAMPVAAHAFGGAVETRFSVPPWMVWGAGGLVVAVSFAVVGAFLTRARPDGALGPARAEGPDAAEQARLAAGGLPQSPSTPHVAPGTRRILKATGLVLWGLVLVAALVPGHGILADTLVWLGLWAALPIVVYLVGDVWALMDPFRTLVPWVERARGGRAPYPYPSRLGTWPSVLLLLVLIGLEVAGRLGDGTTAMAGLVALYSLFTLTGMLLFGSGPWLDHVEPVGRVFRWWGAFAPFGRTPEGWRARMPGHGLPRLHLRGWGDVAFTVAILLGVNYDAFLDSGPGARALAGMQGHVPDGAGLVIVLVVAFALFLGAFVLAVHRMRRAAETTQPPRGLAMTAVVTLVPIAVGYHLAHNLFFVYENAPRVLHALGDPFALGWAPFSFLPATLPLPAAAATTLGAMQIVLILIGHVLAVVVAHQAMETRFPSRVQALRGETPLTAVMVVYTLVGLWLVSLGPSGVVG